MKKLAYKLCLLLPIPIIISIINYTVDPANIFKPVEENLAEILTQGKNIANFPNCDERLLQKFYIEKLKKPKEIIVVGSSRSMQIGKDIFQGHTFFNNSTSAAAIEDYISIYGIYKQKNLKPNVIIMGIDPFNRGARFDRVNPVF